MLKLKKIAITGGVASGKSTVCQLFQKLGAYVVSADAIAHELLDPRTDLGRQILSKLGNDILQNGDISRPLVAEKVFRDPERLHELEKILHPEILRRIEREYESACRAESYTSFIVEIPLLFEIGAEKFYDVVLAVIADEEIARDRFYKQGHSTHQYEKRMSRQWPPAKKSAKANYTIKNNGSLDDLKSQVEQLNAEITGVSHP
jgi:dephospho-CoA kinase